jgi:hypothetical protein
MTLQTKVDYKDVTRFVGSIKRYQVIERQEYGVAAREGTAIIHTTAKKRAAVDKGRMRNSIGFRVGMVQRMPMGVVEVGTRVYPSILDKSARTHYRRGPRSGSPTKGWFSLITKLGKVVRGVERRYTLAFHRIINRIRKGGR